MQNKVVVHIVGGKILKGTTANFFPNREVFHLQEKENGENLEISVSILKAVYFVKAFEGSPEYDERTNMARVGCGRKIKIYFKDGETQIGYTQGYTPGRSGLFVFPVDPESNNERIYIVAASTSKIEFL